MYRGRAYHGPGFWMGGRGYFPGARGFRRGGGFGRGWCRYRMTGGLPYFEGPWAGPPGAAGYIGAGVDESVFLKEEAAALRSEAEAIKMELAEIEGRLARIEQLDEK